jgi:hypothetical protein
MELLQISGILRMDQGFVNSAIGDKGFQSLAFAVLLSTKT